MKKTVIYYLFVTPVLAGANEKYGVIYLRRNGYQVMLYDLSPYVQPVAFQTVKNGLEDYSENGIERCFNRQQIRRVIQNAEPNSLFLPMFSYGRQVDFIFRYFTRYHIRFGHINNVNTDVQIEEASVKKYKNYFYDISMDRIMNSFYIHIVRKISKYKCAEFMVLGGKHNKDSYRRACLCNEETKTIYLHSFDYEKFIQGKMTQSATCNKKKYCVFLDQYIPFHPDGIQEGMTINASSYYQELCKFFGYIQKERRIEVMIAAHPKADYDYKPDCFKGFEIIKGQTNKIIEGAEFVMAHFSTAISYVVLFQKPLLVLMTDTFYDCPLRYRKTTQKYADILAATLINISGTEEELWKAKLEDLRIDKKAYAEYITEYIKADYEEESREESLWSLFERKILRNEEEHHV